MKIGEMAKAAGISEYTLWYYEKKWTEYLDNLDDKIVFYKDSIDGAK